MKQSVKTNTDLGTGSIGGHLYRLALPAVTAQIVNVLYNMVDRVYVGRIDGVGAQALTGLGVCMPIIMIVSAFAALAGMGGAPLASIKMGEGDNAQAEKIMGNCVTMLCTVGIVITLLLILFGEKMLWVFGASANTITYAADYLNIYALGTLFVQLSLGLNAFVTAQGFAKTSMLTVLIGAVCNIILDPLFIFAFKMGVRGAALATILSQALSALFVMRFLTGKQTMLKIKPANLKPVWQIVKPCLMLGLSPFIMQATEGILTLSFNQSLQNYAGDVAVGAMTILATLMQFSNLPLIGLTQGAQPLISYNYGAKNKQRVRASFMLCLKVGVAYTLVIWALAMFAPTILVGIFTTDEALIAYAVWAIRIYMAASFLMGVQIVCQQTFIAVGNAKTSVFLALLRKVLLLIPLIYILPNFFSDKAFAVFLAEPVADVIAVATTLILFIRYFKGLVGKKTENVHKQA